MGVIACSACASFGYLLGTTGTRWTILTSFSKCAAGIGSFGTVHAKKVSTSKVESNRGSCNRRRFDLVGMHGIQDQDDLGPALHSTGAEREANVAALSAPSLDQRDDGRHWQGSEFEGRRAGQSVIERAAL